MMETLALLQDLLQGPSSSEVDPFDPRLDQVVTYIEQEKLTEATSLIRNAFQERILDIRLIAYYLYIHFINRGVQSLKEAFSLLLFFLHSFVETKQENRSKEKVVHNSLIWFFAEVIKKLKYSHQKSQKGQTDLFWNTLVLKIDQADLEEVLLLTNQLRDFLHKTWEQPKIGEKVMHLAMWLEELKEWIVQPLQQKVEEVQGPTLSPEIEPSFPVSPLQKPYVEQSELSILLTFSDAIQLLFKKLKTFETFIKEENFMKAALLAQDIERVLREFNPLVYFPKLFCPYLALVAKHADPLASFSSHKDSSSWRALEQLYHADLEEFIQW